MSSAILHRALALVALLVASSFALVACDGSTAVKEPISDVGTTATTPTSSPTGPSDGGPPKSDAGPSDCVENPKTHGEIVNACTNAVRITKNPVLPKLLPDGGLPPLP